MRDTQLYQQILGLSEPWTVTSVELDRLAGNVLVNVEQRPDAVFSCPNCGASVEKVRTAAGLEFTSPTARRKLRSPCRGVYTGFYASV